jgi:glycerol-3-phosphate dehydrogenase
VNGRRVVNVNAKVRSVATLEISARLTINATGAAVDRLLKPIGLSAGVPMVRAMNLVTKRDAGDEALGGRSSMGRYLFLVPWRERALFGTWESDRVCDPADTSVAEGDVASFIAALNQAFPALDLLLADVTLIHHGLVPAVVRGGHAAPAAHEQIRDHATEGREGLISIAGTKYTTARGRATRHRSGAVEVEEASGPIPDRHHTSAWRQHSRRWTRDRRRAARARRGPSERHHSAPDWRVRIALSRCAGPGGGAARMADAHRP